MNTKGPMNDMYKQIQEVMQKCDNLSLKITTLKKEHSDEIKTKL